MNIPLYSQVKRAALLRRESLVWPLLAVAAAIAGQYRLLAGDALAAGLLYSLGVLLVIWITHSTHSAARGLFSNLSAQESDTQESDTQESGTVVAGRSWLHREPLARVLLAALFTALLFAAVAWVRFDFDQPSNLAWYAYCSALAILLLIACSPLVPALRNLRQRLAASQPIHWGGIAGLAALLIVASALRIYELGNLPFGTWYDESAQGLEALRIATEPHFRPVFSDGVVASGHYLYLIVLFFELFGVETASIRLISALMGVGAVAAAYGVGHLLLGPSGGIVFALLLTVSRWAINFSRVGMYNISTPFFALLAVFFLLRGLRSGRLTDFVAAGLAVGMGATLYSAYLLFVPVLGLIVLVSIWHVRRAWRNQLRRVALGVAVLSVTVGVFMAPTAKYALELPDKYFSRIRETSLLERTAPEARFEAIASNARQHVRMFHVRGDPNGRHNLPGRPMLDPVSGALMLLGLAMCLARWREPFSWVIPVWLGVTLLPGILSLDFESPQSLRAIGSMPPAYLLAALPVVLILRRAFETGHVGFAQRTVGIAAAAVLLGSIAYVDVRTYFVEQAQDFATWNAYSTPETLTARLLKSTPGMAEGEVEAQVISLYEGHPTIRFLAPEASQNIRRLGMTDTLPILVPPARDILLIADADRSYFFEEAQALYPDARFDAIQPPFGGPTVLYTVYLTIEDQRALHGARVQRVDVEAPGASTHVPLLDRVHTPADGGWSFANLEAELAAVDADIAPECAAQTKGPLQIEWEAILYAPSYGPHWFLIDVPDVANSDASRNRMPGNDAPGNDVPVKIELYIGEALVAISEDFTEHEGAGLLSNSEIAQDPLQGVVLAEGAHALRIRATVAEHEHGSSKPLFRVYWRPPDREWEPLPEWLIYHEPARPQGLLGRYFANGDWQPPEAFARVDGRWEMYFHDLPLPRPYTVEWSGALVISERGEYGLGVQSTDESTLWLNGEEIAHSQGEGVSDVGRVDLEEGLHEIRIRYADRTHHTNFRLFWELPGKTGRSTIPNANLMPPQGEYTGVEWGEFAAPIFQAPIPHTEADEQALWMAPVGEPGTPGFTRIDAGATVTSVVDGLEQPTTVAIGRDGMIWIAEPHAGRVVGYSAAGEEQVRLSTGVEIPFMEPYALAVEPDGNLLVLDAEAGRIHRFSPTGEPRAALQVDAELVMRSRGIYVDKEGAIWMAATSRGELIKLDSQGEIQGIIPHRTGGTAWQAAQPVDVVVDHEGYIWVTDPGVERLVTYGPQSQRLLAWDIPRANTFLGPQMAIHPDGLILRSSPEEGQLIGYHPAENLAVVWQLRSHESPALLPVGVAVTESGTIWVVDGAGGKLLRVELDLPAQLRQ